MTDPELTPNSPRMETGPLHPGTARDQRDGPQLDSQHQSPLQGITRLSTGRGSDDLPSFKIPEGNSPESIIESLNSENRLLNDDELQRVASFIATASGEDMKRYLQYAADLGYSPQILEQAAELMKDNRTITGMKGMAQLNNSGEPTGQAGEEEKSLFDELYNLYDFMQSVPPERLNQLRDKLKTSFGDLPEHILPTDESKESVKKWLEYILPRLSAIPKDRLLAEWREVQEKNKDVPDAKKAEIFDDFILEQMKNVPGADRPLERGESRIPPEMHEERDPNIARRVVLGEKRQELIEEYKKLPEFEIGPGLNADERGEIISKVITAAEKKLDEFAKSPEFIKMINDKEAELESAARNPSREAVPTIKPPDYPEGIVISHIQVRSQGFPFPIEIWASKDKAEGSYEDQQAKFMWALRKFEQAEAIAASTSTSLENPTVQSILTDVQYAAKALEDSPLPGNKEVANLIITELTARLNLFQAYHKYINSGTVSDAFNAVQSLTMKYFINYFQGTRDQAGKEFISYANRRKTKKVFIQDRGWVDTLEIDQEDPDTPDEQDQEKKYEKAPVADALAYIDNFSDEYMKLAYVGQREFKREIALKLAEVYLDPNELKSFGADNDKKIDRMIWAVEMAEKLFHLSTRYGLRNTMDPKGKDPVTSRGFWSYIGGDEGVAFAITRTSHLGYSDFDDMGIEYPTGLIGFDGCGVNSWLNTKQQDYANYPMLLRGIDLKCQDFFTYMSDWVERTIAKDISEKHVLKQTVVDRHLNWIKEWYAKNDKNIPNQITVEAIIADKDLVNLVAYLEAKRIMGIEPEKYNQEYIAIYDEYGGENKKGRYYKPGDTEWEAKLKELKGAKRDRGLRGYSWKRSRFNLAKIKWNEIPFDQMPNNTFSIKYWYYGQYFKDELRKGLLSNPDSFLRNPNYERLKAIKNVWQDMDIDDPTAAQATIFANMINLLMYNSSQRQRSSIIEQEEADKLWAEAKSDGVLISDPQSQKKAIEAMGGMKWVAFRRSRYLFNLFGFIFGILSGTLTKPFALPKQ